MCAVAKVVAVALKGGMAVVKVEGVRMAYDNE
jgi:hypothetical protein